MQTPGEVVSRGINPAVVDKMRQKEGFMQQRQMQAFAEGAQNARTAAGIRGQMEVEAARGAQADADRAQMVIEGEKSRQLEWDIAELNSATQRGLADAQMRMTSDYGASMLKMAGVMAESSMIQGMIRQRVVESMLDNMIVSDENRAKREIARIKIDKENEETMNLRDSSRGDALTAVQAHSALTTTPIVRAGVGVSEKEYAGRVEEAVGTILGGVLVGSGLAYPDLATKEGVERAIADGKLTAPMITALAGTIAGTTEGIGLWGANVQAVPYYPVTPDNVGVVEKALGAEGLGKGIRITDIEGWNEARVTAGTNARRKAAWDMQMKLGAMRVSLEAAMSSSDKKVRDVALKGLGKVVFEDLMEDKTQRERYEAMKSMSADELMAEVKRMGEKLAEITGEVEERAKKGYGTR
jgi:hypothetical protein